MRNHIREFINALKALRFRRPEAMDLTVLVAVGVALLAGLGLVVWLVKGPSLVVNNGHRPDLVAARSPLTGRECPDPTLRPIAVMLASDPEARPLSGIRAADMVFEAPVTPGGITRMMGIFQCAEPKEVGSVRSARETFIPFVLGFDAIYAHWGGEHDVLAQLDAGITDNVDALIYEGTVYFRKSSVPRPHNGFTTIEAVREKAGDLGYRSTTSLDPYAHDDDMRAIRNLGTVADTISVPGPVGMDVVFRYDSKSKTYRRWRGGEPEIDHLDDRQVAPSVVIVMDTTTVRTYDQYIDLKTVGQGVATIYQGGRSIPGRWEKANAEAPLRFLNAQGAPIVFTPGQIWVTIRTDL